MNKYDYPDNLELGAPVVDATVFIAEGARVVGHVVVKSFASIWYNAVLRGDLNQIYVGEGTNIQDGVIVHLENDRGCSIGDWVTVGHGAILHGCTIYDGVLIGMGAIIMNGAVIGPGSIIGAGAVVTENMEVPPLSMVVGVPAKIVRTLPDDTLDTNKAWAKKYVKLAALHQNKASSSQ